MFARQVLYGAHQALYRNPVSTRNGVGAVHPDAGGPVGLLDVEESVVPGVGLIGDHDLVLKGDRLGICFRQSLPDGTGCVRFHWHRQRRAGRRRAALRGWRILRGAWHQTPGTSSNAYYAQTHQENGKNSLHRGLPPFAFRQRARRRVASARTSVPFGMHSTSSASSGIASS